MATGTGKTLLCAALIRRFLRTRNTERVLFIVDRIELVKQTMEDFMTVLKEYKPVILFKRVWRKHKEAISACFPHRVPCLGAQRGADEVFDTTTVPTRDVHRWRLGWLPGLADSGWSHRLGWYGGFHVRLSINPVGVVTGFGVGASSLKDQLLAETCFAVRHTPHLGLASVDASAQGIQVTDKGFEGQARHPHGQDTDGAVVICAPKHNCRSPWSRPWRRWLAGIRQLVDIINASLQQRFRLDREHPHPLGGFPVRLAAKRAQYNFSLWLKLSFGRPGLALADLVAW